MLYGFCDRCGHCKRMVGEYKTLGELVQSDPALKNRVVVAKVGQQHVPILPPGGGAGVNKATNS